MEYYLAKKERMKVRNKLLMYHLERLFWPKALNTFVSDHLFRDDCLANRSGVCLANRL